MARGFREFGRRPFMGRRSGFDGADRRAGLSRRHGHSGGARALRAPISRVQCDPESSGINAGWRSYCSGLGG
eukprot:9216289-Pyramimonas_sp.AAC.1